PDCHLPTSAVISCECNSTFNRFSFFFFQAEDGIRDRNVTGVQTCALPISDRGERLRGDPDDGTEAAGEGPGERQPREARAVESGDDADREDAESGDVPVLRDVGLGA